MLLTIIFKDKTQRMINNVFSIATVDNLLHFGYKLEGESKYESFNCSDICD